MLIELLGELSLSYANHLLRDYFIAGALSVVAAVLLDKVLGEPARFHPLVGFGRLVRYVEKRIRQDSLRHSNSARRVKIQGLVAWLLTVVPLTIFVALGVFAIAEVSALLAFIVNTFILYFTLGGRSLVEHSERIYQPLSKGDISQARYAVSMIVSRNTDKMGEAEIASSAIESVLENGNDAVFAPLFWFVVLGAPGAVMFRLANTLDAMWGYKNDKYRHFGFFSAKTDDVLGWVPARITACVYALQGQFKNAIHCWQTQAKQCSSPNGGVVMTAGAGALGIQIGGPTYYHNVLHDKAPMGRGEVAKADVIVQANCLVTRGSIAVGIIWLIASGLFFILMGR
ncbi:adenosylcobinamide-phosphate synthase CbiB [Thaumasiovibrio sp. DFM-14]|uniref:adenosylcobinamide-phosphate synthase CbiB n=1 Tax=Thaumasiovibrio sp. DFM-14 TaxID=3384792 RepID=UPI0039A0C037